MDGINRQTDRQIDRYIDRQIWKWMGSMEIDKQTEGDK